MCALEVIEMVVHSGNKKWVVQRPLEHVNSGDNALQEFLKRETRQSATLKAALKGRHQKSFSSPARAALPLHRTNAKQLNAHNSGARAKLLGATWDVLGGILSAEGAARPVFFVTVTDLAQTTFSATGLTLTRDRLARARRAYEAALEGFNYVAMLDPALFVSTHKTHDCSRLINFHVHAIVWGTTEDHLRVRQAQLGGMKALLPYAKAFFPQEIAEGDLLRVVAYMTKLPRKQHQLAIRESGRSLKQWKRPLNGVNSVRVFAAMRFRTIPQLLLAGGEGCGVREAILKRVATALRQ